MMNNIQLRYKGEIIKDYHVDENGFVISPYGKYVTVLCDDTIWVRHNGIRRRIRYYRALMESYGIIAKYDSHISIAFLDGNEKNRKASNLYWIPFTSFKPFKENAELLCSENQIDVDNWKYKTKFDFSIISDKQRKYIDHLMVTKTHESFDGGYPDAVWQDMREDGWRFIPPHHIIDEYLYRRSIFNNNRYSADKLNKYHYLGKNPEETLFNVFGMEDPHKVNTVISTCVDFLEDMVHNLVLAYNYKYGASFHFPKFINGGEKEYLQHLLKKYRELDRRFSEAVRAKSRAFELAY